MSHTSALLSELPSHRAQQLMRAAREVTFPAGTRIFAESHRAQRFWVLRSGTVALDSHVPGRRAPVVETLSHGDLLGWSWLFPPYTWHLGARAVTEVRAYEFDATVVRALMREDPGLDAAVTRYVAEVVAQRLKATRMRLLDLYGPYGSGPAT
ncbi:cyclic nucleotide-binding domain-containing protein [Streptomyces sp. ODS28]|uniref:cyclic nucleotide-binding domain-containing protein n=1 Tax=Streptomyces sp. ODS28 TaxID=3136688 RepID=UPI0031E58003